MRSLNRGLRRISDTGALQRGNRNDLAAELS